MEKVFKIKQLKKYILTIKNIQTMILTLFQKMNMLKICLKIMLTTFYSKIVMIMKKKINNKSNKIILNKNNNNYKISSNS